MITAITFINRFLLRFIYELDKWDKWDLEKSLQGKPLKRKHQNKSTERVTEDHIWIYPFHYKFLLFIVVIIISFEHDPYRKWNPFRRLTSITTFSSDTLCKWKNVLSQKQEEQPDLQACLNNSFQPFADTLMSKFENLANKIENSRKTSLQSQG